MTDLPFPLQGRTIVVGPSNAGKTWLTARALEAWIDANGPDGVVVFDFAPELVRDGRVLGGRLDRETTIPDGVWYGALDAHAPRASARDTKAAIALAEANARRAGGLLARAPTAPTAAFVNDATIPFQHAAGDVETLVDIVSDASCVVANAFESDELGTDDPVSAAERQALTVLRRWANRVVELDRRS